MRDGFVRRSIKRIALLGYLAPLRLSRAWARARGERPYQLGGSCQGCAKCCEEPAIQISPRLLGPSALRSLILAWQRVVNGFESTRVDLEAGVAFFRCTHFDWQTRRCDSYDSRPGMCRDYPRMLMDQPSPELFEGCGYRAIAPNASGLLRVLDEQPMTEAQRERLKNELRLR